MSIGYITPLTFLLKRGHINYSIFYKKFSTVYSSGNFLKLLFLPWVHWCHEIVGGWLMGTKDCLDFIRSQGDSWEWMRTMDDEHFEPSVYSSHEACLWWANVAPRPHPQGAPPLQNHRYKQVTCLPFQSGSMNVTRWWCVCYFQIPLRLQAHLQHEKETRNSTCRSSFSSFLRAHCWEDIPATWSWTCSSTCLPLPHSETLTETLFLPHCEQSGGALQRMKVWTPDASLHTVQSQVQASHGQCGDATP